MRNDNHTQHTSNRLGLRVGFPVEGLLRAKFIFYCFFFYLCRNRVGLYRVIERGLSFVLLIHGSKVVAWLVSNLKERGLWKVALSN